MAGKPADDLAIVRYGHPALREKAARVGRVTDDVRALVERMVELMHRARGLGLAANQVGIPRRVAVIELDEEMVPLVDPEIVSSEGAEAAEEGCLSLPRLYGQVTRPTQVVVRYRDLSGRRRKLKAEGLLARAVVHELDHLAGRLFIDQVDESSLHWLLGTSENGEAITQPTALEDALKVFLSAPSQER